MTVQKIPQGYQALCPYMTCNDAARVVAFITEALGGEVRALSKTPDGVVMNAEVKVRDSMMMIGDCRGKEARPGTIYMYSDDCDALYRRALAAGATSLAEPADMFYGDRHCGVVDMGGNHWWFATHKEDVSDAEIARRAEAAYGKK